ncbi:hypothetical protein J7L67_08090 [bacterium]|nr:hypothetical protein [bacterium]
MVYIKRNSPFFIAAGVLLGIVFIHLMLVLTKTDGHFAYALDDSYIHMAMAKNIVTHGVWGVTKHSFSSTSSSPLWTIVLSFFYFVTGVHTLTPFILNILISLIFLFWVYKIALKESKNKIFLTVFLISLVLFIPLPSLIFIGIEHILHTFLNLMFIYYAVCDISDDEKKAGSCVFRRLLIIAPLAVMARYESLCVVFLICCLYILKRDYKKSGLLFIFSIIPIAVLGFISVSKGWYFFPNSVMLKSAHPEISFSGILIFLQKGLDKFYMNTYLVRELICALCLGGLSLFIKKRFLSRYFLYSFIFIVVLLIHICFARIGMLQRYVGYLNAAGIFSIAFLLFDYFKTAKINFPSIKLLRAEHIFIYIVFFIFVLVIAYDAQHCYYSLFKLSLAPKNIYEQQCQTARFIKQYYNNQSIALNDIGAVNYYSDVYCTDLWGLANMYIADARLNKNYSVKALDIVTKYNRTKIAVIYDGWFKPYIGGLPDNWTKVGEWIIQDNIVCGGNAVSFYAVEKNEIAPLSAKLKLFDSKLPKSVIRRYNTKI